MRLTDEQLDRALGVALASAAGDALGAGYEFEPGWSGDPEPEMVGGGLGCFAPGEWTDDTTMAWGILEPVAHGLDLRSDEGLDEVARHWYEWAAGGPADIGVQSRALFGQCPRVPSADELTGLARAAHEATGRTAGNGSLMRTWPVALAFLDDEQAMAAAVRSVCQLTHWDELNVEACLLWCAATRRAVLDGELDVRAGMGLLNEGRIAYWNEKIAEAESGDPSDFEQGNGFVVTALQAAWSAIVHAQGEQSADATPGTMLVAGLRRAVRIGNDTDTVAAIAGQLLGARFGASSVPGSWREALHGYPGITGDELVELARRVVTQ